MENSKLSVFHSSKNNSNITNESLKASFLSHKLSLRKEKVQIKLMTKRAFESVPEESYQINVSELNLSEEIKQDVKGYIKTKFDVKSIFNLLFSKDVIEIKTALYLLNVYVTCQIVELPLEKRFLSRNDYDLVNKLCSLLICPEPKIKYDASSCLINITNFPEKIENRVYTQNNLKYIFDFFQNSDSYLYIQSVQLIANCCAKNKSNQKYFIEQNILEALSTSGKDTKWKLSQKGHIIRCIHNVGKLIKAGDEYKKLIYTSIDNIKEIFIQLLKYPISDTQEYYYFLINLFNNFIFPPNEAARQKILCNNFPHYLFEYYYKLDNYNSRKNFLKFIVDFCEGSDSQVQLLLDEGLIDILKQAINEFRFSHRDLLKVLIFGVSNIGFGTLGQVELLHNSKILIDIIEIGQMFYQQIEKFQNNIEEEKDILKECLYACCSAITGSTDTLKYELCTFNECVLIKMMSYGLKNYKDNSFIHSLLSAMLKLIIMEENMMTDMSIKKMLIENGIEDFLQSEVIKKHYNNCQGEIARQILDALKEENTNYIDESNV